MHVTSALPVNSGAATRLWLRVVFALFGVFLAAQAVWILIAESYRPDPYLSSSDQTAAASARANQERAYKVAALETIRGDLWAESAFTTVGQNWSDRDRPLAADDGKSNEQIWTAIARALRFSPHRGDVWLLFAAMVERYRWPGYQPDALLKMSYYTAPNELALLPLRLDLSLKVRDGVGDDELKELVRRDIQIILTRAPALKPALIKTYRSASTESRAFLERVILEIDPNYVGAVRATSR